MAHGMLALVYGLLPMDGRWMADGWPITNVRSPVADRPWPIACGRSSVADRLWPIAYNVWPMAHCPIVDCISPFAYGTHFIVHCV